MSPRNHPEDRAGVEAYLDALPIEAKARTRAAFDAVTKALPGAKLRISYGIPCFYFDEGMVVFVAGWKSHVSLYPVGGVVEALGDAVRPFVAAKGTFKFAHDAPLPLRLLGQIAKARRAEVLASAAVKDAKARPAAKAVKTTSASKAKPTTSVAKSKASKPRSNSTTGERAAKAKSGART